MHPTSCVPLPGRSFDALAAALLAGLLAVTGTMTALASTAQAAEPGPVTVLRVQAGQGVAGSTVGVEIVTALPGDAGPATGVTVTVERWNGAAWAPIATVVTDAQGRASAPLSLARETDQNRVRARIEGPVPGEWIGAAAALVPVASAVILEAPTRVVDERTIRLAVQWSTVPGAGGVVEGVAGAVRLERSVRRSGRWQPWSLFRTVTTDAAGRAVTTARPRYDHRWRVVAEGQPWVAGAQSAERRTRNLPGMTPVALPRSAPRPRIVMPPQRRAASKGADVVVRRISDAQWRTMKKVSWRPGCPVGRSDLRVVETNYWAFDGYRRRGSVVVAAHVVDNFRGVFADFHRARVPIRALRPVDRFGSSGRLGGGDDMRSMAAGNTSVFNCRGVVGQPGRRSPHSWGRSFDLNPWENPFRSAWGVVPNRWWLTRSHPDVAWRTTQHRVVKLLTRNGFRWTYGAGDLHHFDAVPGRGRGR